MEQQLVRPVDPVDPDREKLFDINWGRNALQQRRVFTTKTGRELAMAHRQEPSELVPGRSSMSNGGGSRNRARRLDDSDGSEKVPLDAPTAQVRERQVSGIPKSPSNAK